MNLVASVIVLSTFVLVSNRVDAVYCPPECVCLENATTVLCSGFELTEVPKNLPNTTIILDLSINKLQNIPEDAFHGLYQLQKLNFDGNTLGNDSFENGALNIPSLRTLDLTDCGFNSTPLGLPPNLTTFYFYENSVIALKSDSFINKSSIKFLGLSNINMKVIEENALDPLINVTEIDINNNELFDGSFLPTVFSKNQNLQSLNFNSNEFRKLPNMSFYPASITYLRFDDNNITIIQPYSFRTLENLQTLDLQYNPISVIEDNAFYGLINLSSLNFYADHISTLRNVTFNGLAGLQSLNLHYNNISKIESGAFYPLKNITEIRISNNQLTTLEQGTFDLEFTPKLTTIAIKNNYWICDCHLRWLRQLMEDKPNIIQDKDIVSCNGPPLVMYKRWIDLKAEEFVCK